MERQDNTLSDNSAWVVEMGSEHHNLKHLMYINILAIEFVQCLEIVLCCGVHGIDTLFDSSVV